MLNAPYIVGLTDGEGCFLVSLRRDGRIDLRFFISQAEDNKGLLFKVKEFFKIGTVYQKSSRVGRLPSYVFEVTRRDDIYNVVIPFFSEHQLEGSKRRSFKIFAEIAEIVKGRLDTWKLSLQELTHVRAIKTVMNQHYGSPGAGNPLAGWEREETSNYPNPSRQQSRQQLKFQH